MRHMLPDPELTERFRQMVDRPTGPAYALGWMHRWTIDASRDHANTCQAEECKTCTNFVEALSVCAAVAATMPKTPEVRAALVRLHREQGGG